MAISYADAVSWIESYGEVVAENKQYLTELDSAIGDADHGINMDRGMRAVRQKLDGLEEKDIGKLFKAVGMALVSSVGGAGGPLYGTFFLQLGAAAGDTNELSVGDWARALEAGVKGVKSRGKAEAGDKTMIDALEPAVEALKLAQAEGAPLTAALERSAAAAQEGMNATIPWIAKKGRASYLGERSAGHQDPGATSSYLLLKTAADVWGK